jgi:hypothetical protein
MQAPGGTCPTGSSCLQISKKHNQRPNIRKLATESNLPYGRLYRRIQGSESKSTRKRVNLRLDDAQYDALSKYIDSQDASGSPPSKEIQDAADSILRRSHSDSAEAPPNLAKDWVYRFMKQYGRYARKREYQSKGRG